MPAIAAPETCPYRLQVLLDAVLDDTLDTARHLAVVAWAKDHPVAVRRLIADVMKPCAPLCRRGWGLPWRSGESAAEHDGRVTESRRDLLDNGATGFGMSLAWLVDKTPATAFNPSVTATGLCPRIRAYYTMVSVSGEVLPGEVAAAALWIGFRGKPHPGTTDLDLALSPVTSR